MSIAIHIVSRDPLIIHGYNHGNIFSPMKQMAPYLKDQAMAWTLSINWSLRIPAKQDKFVKAWQRHRQKFPGQKVIVLANDAEELAALQARGVHAVLCNHNAFLNENTYAIVDAPKRYKAIINSRMNPYKRIELARKVEDCCLITYVGSKADAEYEKTIYGHMPHMSFPQYRDGKWSIFLDTPTVCGLYGQSRCGLILSAEEGACFSSAEYLLCGLPVVTTPNLGGRDTLFHEDYVVWCEPDPDSVAEAVDKAIHLPVTPQEIRRRTIARMEEHRDVYKNLLNELARPVHPDADFFRDWESVYVNKMFHLYQDEREAVAALKRQGVPTRFPLGQTLRYWHRQFKERWDRLR